MRNARRSDNDAITVTTARVWVHRSDLATILESLSPAARVYAVAALCDPAGGRHYAYDHRLRRAYCFQCRGLEFISQSWNDVGTEALAKTIFANFPDLNLPVPLEIAERVYRGALDR